MEKANILPKVVDVSNLEEKWYSFWEKSGFFRAEEESDKPPYSIVIPPPNVTGVLHMGHALTVTIQDILIRWRRMQGYNTLWLPGTDHAGIATQMMVERELLKQGITRFDLGREKFLEKMWEWKETYHKRIVKQLKKIGSSLDWEKERFTLDEGFSFAVRKVFVELFKAGLIYQDTRMVNWSPKIRTVLSDLEVEYKEVDGNLWYIKYPLKDEDDYLVVATTRPETMFGDTAVAVNPNDERYKKYIGKQVLLPLTGRYIPVIGDEEVEIEFGTGALKITPAHDFTDFEIGKRHGLEFINIFNDDATLNDNVPEKYRGLDRYEARKQCVQDLKEQGYLVKIEPYRHAVGYCMRSQVPVEPKISKQWFVKIKPLAEKAIEVVENGRIQFIPESFKKIYFNWMYNIRDWCISRQLWWGHQIPVWYCDDCGKVTCELTDPENCSHCGSSNIRRDEDVLDTWFSSALWPFATLGWPEKTKLLETFYPNSVMETGFDILFFWVARMIMMGLYFMKDIPFEKVYLHAMVRDEHGQKMSKTRQNVIDPLEIIEKYGADALRFTLASFTAQGRDIKLSVERIEGYKTFVNKIWNATRYILMNLDDDFSIKNDETFPLSELSDIDRWILTRMNQTVKDLNQALEDFKFNEAASIIYQFTWHEFCDWYIELSKPDLKRSDRRETVQRVLLFVLDNILRMLHPFMPFVTEEIWQKIPKYTPYEKSIMISKFPEYKKEFDFSETVPSISTIIDIISAVRNIKGETGIAPKVEVELLIKDVSGKHTQNINEKIHYIKELAKVSEVRFVDPDFVPSKMAASIISKELEVFVPLKDLIDIESEKKRLLKKIKKIRKDIDFVENKLSKESFVKKAPKHIVEKEKEKLAKLHDSLQKYERVLSFFE